MELTYIHKNQVIENEFIFYPKAQIVGAMEETGKKWMIYYIKLFVSIETRHQQVRLDFQKSNCASFQGLNQNHKVIAPNPFVV